MSCVLLFCPLSSCVSLEEYGEEVGQLQAEVDELKEENNQLQNQIIELYRNNLIINVQLNEVEQMIDSASSKTEIKEKMLRLHHLLLMSIDIISSDNEPISQSAQMDY